MLLQDFDANKNTKFDKINSFLRENFGFTLDSSVSVEDLNNFKQTVKGNIATLKIKENMSPKDADLVKQILMLEGINILLSKKKLVESPSVGPASRVYANVVDHLSNFAAGCVEVGDTEDEAITNAMRQYKSSKYRFPDFEVEYDVRGNVKELVKHLDDARFLGPQDAEVDEGSDYNMDKAGKYVVDPKGRESADQHISGPATSTDWKNVTIAPSERDTGKVSYPNGKKPLPRKGSIQMKENMVKQLRALLESEMEQAEVIIAAKGFSQELQDMIEKVGRLMNEDLPPVSDQMRQAYGPDVAANFQSSTQSELENVLANLRSTKDQIDASVTAISSGQSVPGDTDMDAGMDDSMGGDDFGSDTGDMGGVSPDEFGGDEVEAGDDFGGDMAASGPEEEPLGRATKESKEVQLKRKIEETKRLIAEAKKLKAKK